MKLKPRILSSILIDDMHMTSPPCNPRQYSIFAVLFLCIFLFSLGAMAEAELPIEKKAVVNIIVPMLLEDKVSVIRPNPTGKLNDTGITQCGGYHNNGYSCPQNNFPKQDAEIGRDADQATNDDADGHRGFSFTKISNSGEALPTSATEWSCVKDNVTGLIWEVKTDDGGRHDKDWTYTWHDPNPATNGGSNYNYGGGNCGGSGECNTSRYVTAVNAEGWCGANGWRMPTIEELRSITDLSRHNPAIDTAYFPNTISRWYWSGTSYAYSNTEFRAWYLDFKDGYEDSKSRSVSNAVRLVRSDH